MPNAPILRPAGFVPQMAACFSIDGGAVAVDSANPLPVGERAFSGAVPIVPDVAQAPRRGIAIQCTAPGTVTLALADGSLFAFPVDIGFAILPLAVLSLVSSGTTATVLCTNLA